MLTSRPRKRVTANVTVLALAAALASGSLAHDEAHAQVPVPMGRACVEVGQRSARVDLVDYGWDVLPGQLVLATLNDAAGPGVMLRAAVLAVARDQLTILLTKPAVKPACVAWQILEMP